VLVIVRCANDRCSQRDPKQRELSNLREVATHSFATSGTFCIAGLEIDSVDLDGGNDERPSDPVRAASPCRFQSVVRRDTRFSREMLRGLLDKHMRYEPPNDQKEEERKAS
jgi:hypothetical protein